MINRSNLAITALVAAIGFASPAVAQSISGYGPDGSVVALRHLSNAQQKGSARPIRQSSLYNSSVDREYLSATTAPSGYDPGAETQR
jgi:hypothetical protein